MTTPTTPVEPTTLDPDDHLRLPAVSGWHEQIVTTVHKVARQVTRPHRPRADDVWRDLGVTLSASDRTGRSRYASDLLHTSVSKPRPRGNPTSREIAVAYETLRPRIAKNAADWKRNIDPRDVAQTSLIAIWHGLRKLGIDSELRPARWGAEPQLPGRYVSYLLACVDNALTDLKREQFGSAVPAKATKRLASTIPLDQWEQPGQGEWRDPTDSWCEWLTVQDAINTSPYRATLMMHVAGYSDREIAAHVGMSPATVRQRRSELRARLRSLR